VRVCIEALSAVAGHVGTAPELNSFFGKLTATVAELVHARMSLFWLWDGVDSLVLQPETFGVGPELLPQVHMPCRAGGQDIAERIMFEDHVFRGPVTSEPPFRPYRSVKELLQVTDCVCCSWKAGEQRLGLVAAVNSSRPDGFCEQDVAVLQVSGLAAGLVWQQKQTEHRLHAADQARSALLRKVIDTGEQERQQIAQEIHDDSLQLLAAVQIRLEQLRRVLGEPPQRDLMNTLAATVEQSMASLRRTLFDLRPPALDDDGLAGTVRQFAHLLFDGTGTSCQVCSQLRAEPDESTRRVLYRICREALTNVSKHAGPCTVEVLLAESDGGVLVKVTDDGGGFPESTRHRPPPGHLGLTGMRERTKLAGGWFRLSTLPRAGTTVEVWVPASRPPAEN
jgi:signal transduction histidine kinase